MLLCLVTGFDECSQKLKERCGVWRLRKSQKNLIQHLTRITGDHKCLQLFRDSASWYQHEGTRGNRDS